MPFEGSASDDERSAPGAVDELLRELGRGSLFGLYEVAPERFPEWRAELDALRARGAYAGLDGASWATLFLFARGGRGDGLAFAEGLGFLLLTGDGAVHSLGATVDDFVDRAPAVIEATFPRFVPKDVATAHRLWTPAARRLDLGLERCWITPSRTFEQALAAIGAGADLDEAIPIALEARPLLIAYVGLLRAIVGPEGDPIPRERRREIVERVVALIVRRAQILFSFAIPEVLTGDWDPSDPSIRAWSTLPSVLERAPRLALGAAPVEPLPDDLRPEHQFVAVDPDRELERLRGAWSDHHDAPLADSLLERCRVTPIGVRYAILRQLREVERTEDLPGRLDDDFDRIEGAIAERLRASGAESWPFAALSLRAVHAEFAGRLLPLFESHPGPEAEEVLLSLLERPVSIAPRRGGAVIPNEPFARAYRRSFRPSDAVVERLLPFLDRVTGVVGRIGLIDRAIAHVLAARIDHDGVYERFLALLPRRSDEIAPALVARASPKTTAALRKAARSNDTTVRLDAARALMALGDPEGARILQEQERRRR